jgi:low temperature requirement protein LtrA
MPEPTTSGRRWVVPMRPRDRSQQHRASTPLELLFDLTVVVAVSTAAAGLHHALTEGHLQTGYTDYLMVFFAIWWAWVNFTWFASAYDADDVPYRLLTLVQMAGVLILANGIHTAFDGGTLRTMTIGYVVMRVALVTQWLRAGAGDPDRRAIAHRYALGVVLVQIGWVLRLALGTGPAGKIAFVALAVAELAVPYWAERAGPMTTWHPEHIMERYGLFTLIVLGECILATSTALQQAFTDLGLSLSLATVAASGLVTVFGLWWIYFDRLDAADVREDNSFSWGYGHYAIFAAIAALGAGLQLAAEAVRHEGELSTAISLLTVAVPVAIFLFTTALMPMTDGRRRSPFTVAGVPAGIVLVAIIAGHTIPLAAGILLISLLVALQVAALVVDHHQKAATPFGVPRPVGPS